MTLPFSANHLKSRTDEKPSKDSIIYSSQCLLQKSRKVLPVDLNPTSVSCFHSRNSLSGILERSTHKAVMLS